MTRAATQTERVIAAARSFRGICQVDFLAPDVVDGGTPITRLAARLWDAEQQGYDFECIGKRQSCKVWRLCREPDLGLSEAPASNPTNASLHSASRGHEGLTNPSSPGVSENPTLFDPPTPSVSPYEEAA